MFCSWRPASKRICRGHRDVGGRFAGGIEATCGRILANGSDGCILFRATTQPPIPSPTFVSSARVWIPKIRTLDWRRTERHCKNIIRLVGGRAIIRLPCTPYRFQIDGCATHPIESDGSESSNRVLRRRLRSLWNGLRIFTECNLGCVVAASRTTLWEYAPAGVKLDVANSKTLLTASDTVGYITLVAAPDAPAVTRQLVPLNVHVSINFVMKHTFCGDPLWVSVERE